MTFTSIKVKLHYAYKVRNIGRVCPRLRFCVLVPSVAQYVYVLIS